MDARIWGKHAKSCTFTLDKLSAILPLAVRDKTQEKYNYYG